MDSNLLLLNLLSMASCQAFFVSTRMSFWSSSDKECIPATPNLEAATSYSPNVYNVKTLGTDLPDNEDVWVGYYQAVRVFEYIGCVQMSDIIASYDIQPKTVKINGDPGHCFPGCGEGTIVGTTKTLCYCLGDEFTFQGDRTRTECTTKCNHPTVACGKDNALPNYAYLSIYKLNQKAISIAATPFTSGDTDCLNLKPSSPPTFFWDRCTLSHLVMCYSDDRVRYVNCKDQTKHCTWIDAANVCFTYRLFPTLYSNSTKVKRKNISQLWTGVLKTNVVYKHITKGKAQHDKVQYGYLTKISDTDIKLKFVEADSMKRKLCMKGKPSEQHTDFKKSYVKLILTQISDTDIKLKFAEADSMKRKLCVKDLTTTVSSSTTSKPNTSDTDEGRSGVYIGVGVTIFLILLAVIIIVLIVFCKRRQGHASHLWKRHDNTATQRTDANEYNYPNIEMPGIIQKENNVFKMETNDVVFSDENMSYSTVSESNAYNTIEGSRDYEQVKSENVYNCIDTSENTTYDKAFGGKGSNTSVSICKEFDDAYDTSKEVTRHIVTDCRTDNIYNKTGDTENEEYSHFGRKETQAKTDNVYGY